MADNNSPNPNGFGPQGPHNQGPHNQGPQGYQGQGHPQDPFNPHGEPGAYGSFGPMGPIDPQGNPSANANPGAFGPQGPQGPLGPGGPQGPQGPQGPGGPGAPFGPGPGFGPGPTPEPDNGSQSKSVALVIVGLIVAIVVVLAAILFLGKDNESSSNSATESNTEGTIGLTEEQSTPGSASSPSPGGLQADGSLDSTYVDGLPPQLSGFLTACSKAQFELQYEDGSSPSRMMDGMQCSGTSGSPFFMQKVDLVNDKEYANEVALRENVSDAVIASDTPTNFAGYSAGPAPTLFIANRESGRVLEVENFFGGDQKAREALQALGYNMADSVG